MSNLHLVTQVQAELLRKLKTPAAIKKGKFSSGQGYTGDNFKLMKVVKEQCCPLVWKRLTVVSLLSWTFPTAAPGLGPPLCSTELSLLRSGRDELRSPFSRATCHHSPEAEHCHLP
ncbi:hypothetical protein E5288_WYG019937 [Bos mutus]|uniref:Tbk1/Ikki binding domain-containing protein n=1 Tax=Bos mutus TaxID=72004 RepID=A0A6B0RI38_9CETA|nr:hypothetical protein [Bos mutus]